MMIVRCGCRTLPDGLEGDVFELLESIGDFPSFKESILSFKEVQRPIATLTHLINCSIRAKKENPFALMICW